MACDRGRVRVPRGTDAGPRATATSFIGPRKGSLTWAFRSCPREESNLRTRFRKPLLYPLSYEGKRSLRTSIVAGYDRQGLSKFVAAATVSGHTGSVLQ